MQSSSPGTQFERNSVYQTLKADVKALTEFSDEPAHWERAKKSAARFP